MASKLLTSGWPGSKERRGWGSQYTLQGHSSDLIPPIKPPCWAPGKLPTLSSRPSKLIMQSIEIATFSLNSLFLCVWLVNDSIISLIPVQRNDPILNHASLPSPSFNQSLKWICHFLFFNFFQVQIHPFLSSLLLLWIQAIIISCIKSSQVNSLVSFFSFGFGCFVLFCHTGVRTQGFMFARQVLYRLSCTPTYFLLYIFEIGSCFLPRPAWTTILYFPPYHIGNVWPLYPAFSIGHGNCDSPDHPPK
jgi:hypothetical protein